MREHLAGCPQCATRKARLAALVEQNRIVLDALAIGHPPATTAEEIIARAEPRHSRPPTRTRPLLKAASIAVLLAAGAVVAAIPGSPVREAAVRLVEGLRSTAGPDSRPQAPSATGVAVRTSGRLVVAFATVQDEGLIEVVLEPGATARVASSDPRVAFAVATDSIAVDNAGARASYVVTFPQALPGAEVRVAGTLVFRKTAQSSPRTTIPFASIE